MNSARNSRPPKPRPQDERGLIAPGPIGIAGEPTLEEWKEVRDAAFDELRKHPIPETLIQAIQDFRPHAEVAWVTEQGEPASLNDPAQPIVQPPKKESKESKEEVTVGDRRLKSDDLFNESFPRTAGNALAAFLRPHLARLRRAKASPVRLGKMLPRSTIATIAMDILETNQLFGNEPGEELVQLLRELLDVDKQKAKADRQFVARDQASWILAQADPVPTRVLARTVGVNASSISRWRKEPAFREMIQDKKKAINDLESRGLWPPKLDDQQRSTMSVWRNACAQVREVLACVGPILNGLSRLTQKKNPKGRGVGNRQRLIHKLPELQKLRIDALNKIEAEIKGIDEKLASDAEERRPIL